MTTFNTPELSSGESKGGAKEWRTFFPNTFIFMQFSTKRLQNNNNIAHSQGVGIPPLNLGSATV